MGKRLARIKMAEDNYLKLLKKRSKESRVYKKYQLVGLEIAELLEDRNHKSLYIKLAKERGREADSLLRLAKEISENKNIKKRGAYFMRLISDKKQEHGK